MKETSVESISCCTIVGLICGDRIVIQTRTGSVQWLKQDAPVYQRSRFFDALFGSLAPAGSKPPPHHARRDEPDFPWR